MNPNLPWQTTYRALFGAVKLGTSRGVKHIQGVDGMTVDQLQSEIERGGRFVVYTYCISALVMTFRRTSAVVFVPASENRTVKGLKYAGLSFLLGWWGIPWGLIYTPNCLVTDLKGGRDVTARITPVLLSHSLATAGVAA